MSDLTLDQRLDRLTERHEALTQSVESLAASSREIGDAVKETNSLVRSLVEAVAADGEHIRVLVRIAEIHERRLTSLEGGEEGEK